MDGWTKVAHIVNFAYILALLTLTLAGVVVYSIISPYAPAQFSDVTLEPTTVCPSELVEVNGKTSLDDGRYTFTIDPEWHKLGEAHKTLDESQVDGAVEGPIYDKDASSELVYISPPERGKWVFHFEVMVEGRNILMPRTQYQHVVAEKELNVVDCGDNYNYEEYSKEN